MAQKQLAAAVTFICLVTFCGPQQIPATQAKALDKSEVVFPAPGSTKLILLVISFSHRGQKECDIWNQRLRPTYAGDPRIVYYELADFQGVPSFVMRLILHGMRRSVPKDEWPHFVPFFSQEDAWKKVVRYTTEKEAYVLVADAGGNVVWQAHGAPDDPKLAELSTVIKEHVAKP
jgi:hypothetical protein